MTDITSTQRYQDATASGGDAFGNNALIASPSYQSYSTGPGLQAGQGTPADVGYNGNAPGAGESYASAALGYYGAGNVPGVSNNQQQNYDKYQQFQLSAPADMSSYYDNAQRLQDNALNTQMAARGSFGSSNAIGQLSAADTNLRAQQARDQAQYGLQRDALGMQQYQLGGSLAGGADQQSNNASRNQLDWTQGLGNLAFQGQQAGLQRYEQGNQDAMQAAGVLSGLEGANYGQQTQNDQSLMDSAMNAQNGALTNNSANLQNDFNRRENDSKDTMNALGSVVKAGVTAGMG